MTVRLCCRFAGFDIPRQFLARLAEMPALAMIDAGGAHQAGGCLVLDELRDCLDAEFLTHRRDGFDECATELGMRRLAHEAAVDLDVIDAQAA